MRYERWCSSWGPEDDVWMENGRIKHGIIRVRIGWDSWWTDHQYLDSTVEFYDLVPKTIKQDERFWWSSFVPRVEFHPDDKRIRTHHYWWGEIILMRMDLYLTFLNGGGFHFGWQGLSFHGMMLLSVPNLWEDKLHWFRREGERKKESGYTD